MENTVDINSFIHSFPIQVRWADLDLLGHVNNASYLTYFEIARGRYIQTICPDWNWTQDMFLIANANVEFKKELRMTDYNISVRTKIVKIGQKSFVIEYIIVSGQNQQYTIHASGYTTQVMFDMQERKTIEIPNWIRKILTEQLNIK